MTVMFFTASIPIAEKRSAERRPGWETYKAKTPMVFPRLRK
jgi:steroid 5-alpha reductase family enzyme